MAYSVSNGAIGKSPLIDQMNHLPCGQKTPIFPLVPISFEGCKKELEKQLEGGKAYGRKSNEKNSIL